VVKEGVRPITFVSRSGEIVEVTGISREVLAELEARALQQGISLADAINDALRLSVGVPPKKSVH
jgi:hypothetical protein